MLPRYRLSGEKKVLRFNSRKSLPLTEEPFQEATNPYLYNKHVENP